MKQHYKVAILYICTGQYDIFWEDFFTTAEQFFLPNHTKEYFVFTDTEQLFQEENPRIHKIYQENLGWPFNTLKRFEMFLRVEDQLRSFDFIFFMNANLLFLKEINEEFLPFDEDLLVVQHPGFWDKDPNEFTYERNPKSLAHIPYGQGRYYVCGGVNGGKVDAFIQLTKTLKANIENDLNQNIIAIWHDESHLNHYILNRSNYKLLSPSYCYPQGWKLPFEKIILVKDKKEYFDVNAIKNISFLKKILSIAKTKLRNIAK